MVIELEESPLGRARIGAGEGSREGGADGWRGAIESGAESWLGGGGLAIIDRGGSILDLGASGSVGVSSGLGVDTLISSIAVKELKVVGAYTQYPSPPAHSPRTFQVEQAEETASPIQSSTPPQTTWDGSWIDR